MPKRKMVKMNGLRAAVYRLCIKENLTQPQAAEKAELSYTTLRMAMNDYPVTEYTAVRIQLAMEKIGYGEGISYEGI